MVGNVKHCRDDAVFQFYQKNCALKIGLLVTLMTFSIQAVVFIDFFFFFFFQTTFQGKRAYHCFTRKGKELYAEMLDEWMNEKIFVCGTKRVLKISFYCLFFDIVQRLRSFVRNESGFPLVLNPWNELLWIRVKISEEPGLWGLGVLFLKALRIAVKLGVDC